MTIVYMHVFQSVILVDRLCPEILSTFIKEKALHCKGVSFEDCRLSAFKALLTLFYIF